MGQFRGSRKLMARKAHHAMIRRLNREAAARRQTALSPEAAQRRRLDQQAKLGFVFDAGPRLIKRGAW